MSRESAREKESGQDAKKNNAKGTLQNSRTHLSAKDMIRPTEDNEDDYTRGLPYRGVKKLRPTDSAWELALWRQLFAF